MWMKLRNWCWQLLESSISARNCNSEHSQADIRRNSWASLTNAFSKKMENQAYAVALHFMHYNFAWIHQTLRVTPAMEGGVADHVWSLEEIAELLDRGKDKKTPARGAT